MIYTVAVYHIELCYGGPEEGGWWYRGGPLVTHALEGVPIACMLTACASEADADEQAAALQSLLDAGPNKGARPLSSMLSTGRYEAEVCEGAPYPAWPAQRPCYE